MTSAQTIFELAMHLMDEVSEAAGQADNADTKEYKNRTLGILNVLRCEAFPASDTYAAAPNSTGARPVCPVISDFTSPVGLDDAVAQGVLPYGLAAHLLLDENPDVASYFHQRYEELLNRAARGVLAGWGEILNPYGGIELGEFAHW